MTNRLSGISLEADLKIPGTVLSVVGHVSDHGEVRFQGVGPRVTHDLGPLSFYSGHYLFGNLSAGGVATAGLDAKKGAGIEIPIYKRAVIRIGADHDGTDVSIRWSGWASGSDPPLAEKNDGGPTGANSVVWRR